jgi:uncharacterized membrane protein
MNDALGTGLPDRFPLARVLILLLAGGFMGLMLDIRVEHVDVVRERAIGWVPIIYSGVMGIACLVAVIFWNKTVRLIMLPLFLIALIVGGMGFYFHSHGNIVKVIRTTEAAWTDPNMEHPDAPPQLAPLAFAGLGVIGSLASLRRFNP